jgi:hypothetical protein
MGSGAGPDVPRALAPEGRHGDDNHHRGRRRGGVLRFVRLRDQQGDPSVEGAEDSARVGVSDHGITLGWSAKSGVAADGESTTGGGDVADTYGS